MSVLVEVEAVYTGLAAVGGSLGERAAVIYYIVLILAGYLYHGVVSGTGGYGRVLLKNLAHALKRAERRVGYGVGHAVVGAAPAAFRPHEVVLALALEHERALHVVLGRHLAVCGAVVEGHDAQQVVAETHHVAVSPSAVVHVVLAVVVAEHELVYGLCPVHDVVDERLAQRVSYPEKR